MSWSLDLQLLNIINKARGVYSLTGLMTTLQKGTYKDVRTGWEFKVQADHSIVDWEVPGRTAVMFVRVHD